MKRRSLKSLLIVGHDAGRVNHLARTLAEAGYRVATSTNGEEGRAEAFDLTLCLTRASDSLHDVVKAWRGASRTLVLIEGEEHGTKAVAESPAGSVNWISSPENDQEIVAAVGQAIRAQKPSIHEADPERFQRAMNLAPVGVFEIDGDRFTYVNEHLAAVLRYPADELVGARLRKIVAAADADRLAAALTLARRSPAASAPETFRWVTKGGEEREVELVIRRLGTGDGACLEGAARDVTAERRLVRLHNIVTELAQVILGEQDMDRILQIVLDTITEYSGFRRAVLTLYDLSVPSPIDGAATRTLMSGLSPQQRRQLLEQTPLSPADRRSAFVEEFRLGPAYYIPHDRVPWETERGIVGTRSMDGWHVDDFLFIPLRATAGIVGSISVDDPVDQSAPTLTSIEPIGQLASFAALAVERVYKLNQLRDQNERLHSLSRFGDQVAHIQSAAELCDAAARRICDDMGHDYCGVWLRGGESLVLGGLAASAAMGSDEIPKRGATKPVEGEGLTRWAIRYTEPVVVDDVSHDARYVRTRSSIRSMAAIPIHGRKGVRGALDVESRRLAAFGDQDVTALSTLASQVSVALSALERREAFSRIYGFGQRISEASTVEQVVASTLDLLAEQFSYPLCLIFLQGRDGRLSMAGSRGPQVDASARNLKPLSDDEKGIVPWVGRNRRFALVNDVTVDPRYVEAVPGIRSEIAVPLVFAGQLVGVLDVESSQPGFFDEEDRILLEVVANSLATALANLSSQESLREQAIRDPLTGLFNRHYFNTIIAPEVSRSDRYARPFAVMMVDVDGFRAVNNRHGHLKGDEVLQEVARFLSERVREADRVVRYGGDEFLVFMPETEEGEATAVAARLREQIADLPRRVGVGEIPMGLSIGICVRQPREKWSLEAVLEEVDRRLYADKRARHVERADDYSC